MLHRLQAVVMLLMMALMLPSSGAVWAYCQRTGEVHAAAADCCVDEVGSAGGCCGRCDPHKDREPCCIEAGKIIPDAVMPDAERFGGPVLFVLPLVPAAGVGVLVADLAGDVHAPRLRAPPPPARRFLALRSLRL